jgi:hypothetical protein
LGKRKGVFGVSYLAVLQLARWEVARRTASVVVV